MKIDNSYTNKYTKKNTFGAVKKIKCEKLFNPLKYRDDLSAFATVFLSESFRYLIKHRDVSFVFERRYRPDDKRMATILHFDVMPIQTKKISLIDKVKQNVLNCFLPNRKKKRFLIEGWVDIKTGAKKSIKEQIDNITIEKIKNYM